MPVKKIIIGLILASLGCIVLAEDGDYTNSFKPGTEPAGFRNIEWGTPMFNLEKENFRLARYNGNEKVYVKEKEDYLLDRVKVDKIEYYFWDGVFYKVNIYVNGRSKKSSLLLYVFRHFGRINKTKGCYRYKGSKTGIIFCGQPGQDSSVLTLYSLFHLYRKDYNDN